MSNNKLQDIESYLQSEFLESAIEQKNDFDSGDHLYKIQTDAGLLLLHVGNEFVGDNSIEEILNQFSQWEVAQLLRDNSRLGILVTSRGASKFDR